MLVTHCYYQGIRFSNVSNGVVRDCQVIANGNNASFAIVCAIYCAGGSGNQILNNSIANTGGANAATYGIFGFTDVAVIGNLISKVATRTGSNSYGIYQCGFADHNKITAPGTVSILPPNTATI